MKKPLIAPFLAALLVATAALSPALAARPQATVSLQGAGSTFDQPFFTKAFSVYSKHHSVHVDYAGVGSGAGIKQFQARTVDFGATDVPMGPSDVAIAQKAGGAVVQIPVTLGGVSIAYNVPGVKTGLHLNASVLTGIYGGWITKWNDSRIKKLNKKAKLPNLQITPVHRSDSSGTTYIFTDYLSHVSDWWRGNVGTGKTPNWPGTFPGGNHNEGVAGLVQQTPGAIGYVELAYVLQNHMHEAMLQNRKGKFVFPTLKSVSAAAAQFKNVSPDHYSIVDAGGKASYPVVGYSWVLLYKHNKSSSKGKALRVLMQWMVSSGQTYAKQLSYAPLPSNVAKLANKQLKVVK